MRRTSAGRPCHAIFRIFVATLGILPFAAPSAHAIPTVKEMDAAVNKGVAYLLAQQKADGSWEEGPRPAKPVTAEPWVPSKYAIYGGETAIVTYALLAAGQSPQSDPIKKAVDWLEHVDLHGTYAVALRAQVWNLLPEKDRSGAFTFARDRDRDFVYFGRIGKGRGAGFYTYVYGAETGGVLAPGMPPLDQNGQPENTAYDRSSSQYAVLGAWALDQAGAEIPQRYWEDEDQAWKASQQIDGSWTYNNVVAPTMVYERKSNGDVSVRPFQPGDKITDSAPTMTCAGVATLFITQDYIMRANWHDNCNGGVSNANIDRGLAWLDKNIDKVMTPRQAEFYYALYGLERIGVASGRKYIGGTDWFDRGSQALVQTQSDDGSWNSTLHDTSYSILFLVRGQAPVMMNKLIYANTPQHQVDPWDERSRDVANLAKWMGRRSLEGFFNWQLVDLKYPVEQFHDAPILYIAGSELLNLSDADTDKLRLFVEQGGMILGNADCGRKAFATSFKKLGSKLFPRYEFRVLPASHPIFSEQYKAAKWKIRVQLEGLSNGVRELMVLVPDADPGHAWQSDSFKAREELFQLGGNIFLYATGRENLRHKGDSYMVSPQGEPGRPIPIARLMLGDNPDPEPGGWAHLAAIMQNGDKAHLDVHAVKLGTGDLAKYKIAHWTGTTKVQLKDEQRKELKTFVDNGGTLIVDSAGGSTAFADSAQTELEQAFGGAAAARQLATPLPRSHAVFSDPQWKVDEIRYRSFAKPLIGKLSEPRLCGIQTEAGRIGVFYSREDLSAGLVGEQVDGVLGYDPDVAAQLMRSMILYADNAAK
jgi:hypothetical protein